MLQQRGAVLPGEEQAFAADLVKWARESGFKVWDRPAQTAILGAVLLS